MHWKGRDEQLKTLLHVYVDCCIEISWSPQTRSHYHRYTHSKEKGIQVHHESHQIIREQKRKGRKKDIPAHLQKKRQRIHSVGLHSFACKDIWHIWFGMRFGNRKGQHVGQVAERGAPGLGKTREIGHRFHQQPAVRPPIQRGCSTLWGWWRRLHASSQVTDILILVPQVLPRKSLKLVLIHVLKTRGRP